MNFADETRTSHLGEIGNEQGPRPGSQLKTGETAAQPGNGRTPREALAASKRIQGGYRYRSTRPFGE